MREYFRKLPDEIKDLISIAGDIADKLNLRAYLVGGFVRDLILGVKNLDLDIVVEGDGIVYAEQLAQTFGVGIIRHKRFGTATIYRAGLKIDIASARSEKYPHPGSLPVVSAGTLREDLARRDFTINAMAISVAKDDFGRVVDFFKGKHDLTDRQVRILHDLSFIDDPTRILRAVRFEKRFGFKIERGTLSCLRHAVDLGMLDKVSPHRMRDELVLMLKEENPLKQIRRMRELTGFKFLSSLLEVNEKTYSLLICVRKTISWIEKRYPQRRPLDRWVVYLAGLLDSLDHKDIEAICDRLALRNGDKKRILSYKKINPEFIRDLKNPALKPARIFSLLEPLSYEAILLIKAKYRQVAIQRHIEDFFEVYNGIRLSICGDDLRCLGLDPGPRYKKIFTKVLEDKLNGLIKTKEQELALIAKLVEKENKSNGSF